jgi:hypothetical protein
MSEEASAGEKAVQKPLTGFRKGKAVPKDNGNIWFSVRLVPWKNPASGGTL